MDERILQRLNRYVVERKNDLRSRSRIIEELLDEILTEKGF